MWNFSDLRAYLLPLAEEVLGDVDKIIFAREFDIEDWLTPAHMKLCQRLEPLTTEEATKLGVHSLLMIARLREEFRPPRPSSSSAQYYCGNCVGLSYSSNYATCGTCNTHSYGYFYSNNASTQSSATSTALETRVKNWVGDGCVLK
jgi:hypothetical protein